MTENSSQKFLIGCSLIAAILYIMVPRYIFPVCADNGPLIMKCIRTAQAETGVGISLILICGIFFGKPLIRRKKIAAGLIILLSILGTAIPIILIGVCPGHRMPCRMGTQPALLLLSFVLFIIAAYHMRKLTGYKTS